MENEQKIALMFSLAQDQQKSVQNLIDCAQDSHKKMASNALEAAKIASKAVGDHVFDEVKENFQKYESNLQNLISKANQANQALEIATHKFSYKLILGFSIFAFACTLSLLGVSFWLAQTIKEQKQTIAVLEKNGGDFQFSNCNGQICIKVEDNPQFSNGYRIIKRK